jgi:hypothetical protein
MCSIFLEYEEARADCSKNGRGNFHVPRKDAGKHLMFLELAKVSFFSEF